MFRIVMFRIVMFRPGAVLVGAADFLAHGLGCSLGDDARHLLGLVDHLAAQSACPFREALARLAQVIVLDAGSGEREADDEAGQHANRTHRQRMLVHDVGQAIARQCRLAREIAASIETSPVLELLAPVSLNIVCFRVLQRGLQGRALDDFNAAIAIALQESGAAVLNTTRIDGRLALRACIVVV